MNKKLMLMILDGWGKGKNDESDAIFMAKTPNMDRFYKDYASAELFTSGESVGLPNGQMGNSEVGHLNIGAGRVVYQDFVRINKAIEDDSISKNEVIVEAYNYAKENNKQVHLIGLVSDGGVHSSDKHIYKLTDIAKEMGLEKIYIHALMDGRDTDPRSGLGYMEKLENHLTTSAGKVATVCGRYYTMDRDKRWERVKKGYDLIVNAEGKKETNSVEAIKNSYADDITDEFINPTVICDENGNPLATIQEGDVVFCFNFRTDRLREITTVLTQQDMPEYDMKTIPLHYLTMTIYDENFKNVNVVYKKENVTNTLGELVSKLGKKQIRIAETEKYAHVTFFFSGGREDEFPGEKRILIPSPKVATYDLKPEMSAYEVKDAILPELDKQESELIVLNFANCDMVGHTGDWNAITTAVETVDKCVGEIEEKALANNYSIIIIADHGNADNAKNEDGSVNTAHSLNAVPIIVIDKDIKEVSNGSLADVAPSALKLMGIDQPKEMSGKALF